MNRIAALVLAALAVSAPGHLLAGCRGDSRSAAEVSLAELVAGQVDYDGRRVETSGVVRRFGEEEGATRLHFVVEDGRANRVAIVPEDVAAPFTGRRVVVVGDFRFREDEGRVIEIERIAPVS